MREIHTWQNCSSSPVLVPSIWLDILVQLRIKRALGRTRSISDIEQSTELHWTGKIESLKSLRDFDSIIHRLTVIGAEWAWDRFVIDSLSQIQTLLMATQTEISPEILLQEDVGGTNARVKLVGALLYGLRGRTGYSLGRVKVQLQTVYNLIAQRDSKLSFGTARASKDLTEVALRDNTVMQAIAEDSRNVALLTRRDSADMRIISAVTLIFLPGTFTAVKGKVTEDTEAGAEVFTEAEEKYPPLSEYAGSQSGPMVPITRQQDSSAKRPRLQDSKTLPLLEAGTWGSRKMYLGIKSNELECTTCGTLKNEQP
ncbi:hypothetical protein EJ08DRAFT_696708 [Tothia fuscella]|uniref:Uncharacterized protein n=1 Tax=Tothia fuscella TaxID=1048955 RepID=A0A9P4NSG1_9PEZI|nr:hypothetical protein EJ08DRAFT_696708 [Tothia fuscella]